MKNIRYDEKTAKRDHKRTCDLTGVKIEKGDRFVESVVADGRDLTGGRGDEHHHLHNQDKRENHRLR